MDSKKRVFLIVLDSFGIGYEPDAAEYGDEGSNTLKTVCASPEFDVPNMEKLGLFSIDGTEKAKEAAEAAGRLHAADGGFAPAGAFGRMRERSKGKDTTVGHWEIAGMISEKPFPTYPDGFPQEILDRFSESVGRGVLCNKPYSGTDVIRDYGKEHVETGNLIVYTSADSVFQIAAHEEVVPLEELYRDCRIAREILTGEHGVGRVIARPFLGEAPNYYRTGNRHDFALEPPKDTMLDVLKRNGYETISIGKIYDIFAGKGLTESNPTKNNTEGIEELFKIQERDFTGLCFLNLVDFDMVYGHRNNIEGYAKALTEFDRALGTFMERMRDDDILIITADHGCDPGYPGTDHTREYTPMLAYGKAVRPGTDLGTRKSFSDIGKTVIDIFGLDGDTDGESFLSEIS